MGQGLHLGFLPRTGKGLWISPLLELEPELELRRPPEKRRRRVSGEVTSACRRNPVQQTSPAAMLQGNLPGGGAGGATSEASVKGKALAQSLVSEQGGWAWVGVSHTKGPKVRSVASF